MNILALDIAKNTGWAVSCDGAASCGSLDLSEYITDHGRLGVFFRGWLAGMAERYRLDTIVIEEPFGISQSIRHIRGLVFTTEIFCVDHGLTRRFYKAGEWRTAILTKPPRKSAAAKRAVMDWCLESGFKPANTDESDAIGLLTCACMAFDRESRNPQ